MKKILRSTMLEKQFLKIQNISFDLNSLHYLDYIFETKIEYQRSIAKEMDRMQARTSANTLKPSKFQRLAIKLVV